MEELPRTQSRASDRTLGSDISTIVDTKVESTPFDIRRVTSTCDWFLDKNEYREWLENDHGTLWIQGEAGSGKSVLLQHLRSRARVKTKGGETNVVVLSGNENERTPLDLYKSLLWGLFDQVPDVAEMLEVVNNEWLLAIKTGGWQIAIIQDMLKAATALLESRGLQLYIYLSNGFGDDDIMDIVSFLDDFRQRARSQNVRLQICLCSRRFSEVVNPYVTVVILELEPGQTQTIARYIKSALNVGDSERADALRSGLLERCSTNFLWVSLVVSLLNRNYVRNEGDVIKCQEVLEKVSSDLNALFKMILLEDCDDSQEFRLAIQWALFAKEPLTLVDYYDAVHGQNIQDKPLDEDALLRYLQSTSRGFLRISTVRKWATIIFRRGRAGKETVVRFTHELILDFYLKGNGVSALWPDLQDQFEGLSHCVLRSRCEEKIAQVSNVLDHKDFNNILWRHPFVDYALGNIIRHSNSAQKLGLSQLEFIHSFSWQQWTSIANRIGYYALQFSQSASILYMLATQDAGDLIRACEDQAMDFTIESNEQFQHPLIAAVVCKSYSAVTALCSAVLSNNEDVSSTGERALQWKYPPYWYPCDRTHPLLRFLAEFGHVGLMKAFLERHGDHLKTFRPRMPNVRRSPFSSVPMMEFIFQDGQYPGLSDFGRHIGMNDIFNAKSPELVEALIHTGLADINSKDCNCATILHRASAGGYLETVRVLLKNGADANISSLAGDTPLMVTRAAPTASLLLQHGADVKSRNRMERTALFGMKKPSVLDLLLQHGADPNVRDRDGRTPLIEVATGGMSFDVTSPFPTFNEDEVPRFGKMPTRLNNIKLLIRYGADVNVRDSTGQGALNYSMRQDPEIAAYLTSKGAQSFPLYSEAEKALHQASARKTGSERSWYRDCFDEKCQMM